MSVMEAELARVAVDTLTQIARHKVLAEPAAQKVLTVMEERLFDCEFSAANLVLERPAYRTLSAFRAATGFSPHEYISLCRVVIAARLLCETGLGHDRIAELVGLGEKNSLRNYCLKFFGCSPGKLRSLARKARQAGREPFPTLDGFWSWWRGESTGTLDRAERLDQLARGLGRSTPGEEVKVFLDPSEDVLDLQIGALLGFSREKRILLLRRGVCRGSKDVFEALSRRSREEGRTNRQKGVDLAEMALAVVEGSLEVLGTRGADYLALGWARLGNARRLASDLEGADVAIQRAESWAVEAVEGDRVLAEVLHFKSLLRLFQRRFARALTFADEAVAYSQVAGDNLLLIDALHQRASVYLYQAQVAEAMPDLHRALHLLPSDDKRRRMGALQHLLGAAVLADDKDRVDELLPGARRLCAEAGHRPSELQTLWLEGWLLREREEFEAAEPLLKEARAGFGQIDDVGMMAICSLELALLYRAHGNEPSRVMTYAADALPALEALDLPEALGANSLLREAIRSRRIPKDVLDATRRRLLAPGAP